MEEFENADFRVPDEASARSIANFGDETLHLELVDWKKTKSFMLSSQLSIIQAMTELIQKEMYKSLDEVAQYKNDQCKTLVNKEDIKVWIHNLSDLSTNQK
jgi:hypothetical protein